MNNFLTKLQKYVELKKPMSMVNIQMIFIGARPEEDQVSVIKTGLKKIYQNGIVKFREKIIETQIENPINEVLETHKFVKYYDYTLLEGADTFVAQFIPESLNEEQGTEQINLKNISDAIFPLKKDVPYLYNLKDLHFRRIHSAIMDGIYVYVKQNKITTFVKEDLLMYDIPDNVVNNAKHYEFAIMSAAQIKQQKAIFVNANKEHTPANIEKYQPSIPNFDLKSDRGANVFLDEVSLFSWSYSIRGKNVVPNKILAYMSLCLSNSSTVKTPLRIKHIGEIKIQVTPRLIDLLSQFYSKEFMAKITEKDTVNLNSLYKREKWDGMGIIRASKAKEIHLKTHPNDKNKDLYYFVGMACIQRLIPGAKGLLYVVHDDEFDNAVDNNGNFVYKDYDVILEDSNVKYVCHESYLDLNQFEIVRWSKVNKYSHNMSYGYWLALDNNDEEKIKMVVKNIFDKIYEAINDPIACKAYLNMVESQQVDDEIKIEDENLNTIFNKILNICPEAIYDPLLRNALKFIFKNELEKAKFGSFNIEGACRFIVSDPTAFFLTEKMVPRLNPDGSHAMGLNNQLLYDIIVDDIDQLALSQPNQVFWRNAEKEVLLFRAPCYHAGQVPKATMVNQLPEKIMSNNRSILIKNLYDVTYWKGTTIVINALGMMLEAMGGADADGDQATLVEDENIVSMRKDSRDFDIPEDASAKPLKITADVLNFKHFLKSNLKVNKVGIFSNQMTVLGDLSAHILALKKSIGLPIGMLKVLETIAYKVSIALNETSEYGCTFNSYSPSEQKHLLRMKEFSTIFQTLKVDFNGEQKDLKNIINILLYKSLYNTTNVLDMLTDEYFEKFQQAVYNYAEAGRDILSSLQMQEIDSAKTGIAIDLHKYPFLSNTQDFNLKGKKMKLSYAPTWFLNLRGKNLKTPGAYTSLSIPGRIYTKVCEEEAKLNHVIENFLTKDGVKIPEKRLIGVNCADTFPNADKSLRNIVNAYSQERIALNQERQRGIKALLASKMFSTDVAESIMTQYKIKSNEIAEKYNNFINIFMKNSSLPIDKLVTLCYNISVEAAENYYSHSFFLNVLKYEFIIYLLLKQDHANIKLAKVKLLPEFSYTKFENEQVFVENNVVFRGDEEFEQIGKCVIPDGSYTLNTIRDLTYLSYGYAYVKEDIPEIQKCTVIIKDGVEDLITANNKVICRTITKSDKPCTGLFINDIEIGSLVNYGFNPQLHDHSYFYRVLSNTAKRYCFELRVDPVTTNVVEENKPTCFLTGKLEKYTEEHLKKLEEFTIMCEASVVSDPFFELIQRTGIDFKVCANQDEMIMQTNYFVGFNENLLKVLAEKTNKHFLLV